SFSFDEGRVVFLIIVLLISSLLVTVYFNNKYQKEKDLRISVQDELSALQYESGKMDNRAEEIKAEIDRRAAEANKLRQKQEELDPAEETRSTPPSTEYPRESQKTATTPSQPAWADRSATASTPSAPARRVHKKALSAFEITKVEIANIDRSGAVQTPYGSPIAAAESMFLCPRITIKSKTDFSGKYTFHLKFKRHEWDDSSLTVFYETQYDVDMVCSKGNMYLFTLRGSGNSRRGTWSEGIYYLEIWSDGQCLYIHSFGLY
ncbi:hypothetical protein, partial [uncultured Porphyromonas sp.]|uniref:hypothetical protein n=1 Tax=uncultured Porphyromonas sp. TaxID=159274 RepID=UPI0026105296